MPDLYTNQIEQINGAIEDIPVRGTEQPEGFSQDLSSTSQHPRSCVLPRKIKGLAKFEWDIGLPNNYGAIGFETQSHKEWREMITTRMKGDLELDPVPINGQVYERNKDFVHVYHGIPSLGVIISPKLIPMNASVDSQAKLINFIRRISTQENGKYRNYAMSTSLDDVKAGTITFPLLVALELQDWEWLDMLLARGAKLPKFAFSILGPSEEGTVLSLVACWSLSMLKFFLTGFNSIDALEAKVHRIRMLKYVLDRGPSDTGLPKVVPYGSDVQNLEDFMIHAAEIVLSTRPPLLVTELQQSLFEATTKGHKRAIELLLRYNADLIFVSPIGIGTVLHCAIRHEKWDIVPFLVGKGADVNAKAKITTWLSRSSGQMLTPIEFAASRGHLNRLNRVLGTQYKDTRSILQKLRV